MGIKESLIGFTNFDQFDGNRELLKFLGLTASGGKYKITEKPVEKYVLTPPDELTLKMIKFLKHETDEEPKY
ncbi:MAG TPA: hypothetical protein VFI61_04670 [Patescibacteria group bacterium]|nr:hypothetical protein [Patescibacteria group bacterium]